MSTATINFTLDDISVRARPLAQRSPQTCEWLLSQMPLCGTAVHGQWSGQVFEVHGLIRRWRSTFSDPPAPYQYPGLVSLDPDNVTLGVCYGEGRWQDGFGPIKAIPVAEVSTANSELVLMGRRLEFEGGQRVTVTRLMPSQQGLDPTSFEPQSSGSIRLVLGHTTCQAIPLIDVAPTAASSLMAQLPLVGRATNTHSSGPLTRFWNDDGGPEGETILEAAEGDRRQRVLQPGYVYYLPTEPWRGLRLALQDATVMKAALGSDYLTLLPVLRLVGDWTAVAHEAAQLMFSGAVRMELTS